MRASSKSRSRNKPSNGSQPQRRSVGNIINRVFDSAGPDGKVRGTPQQIIDKYNVLARDAQLAGDRVAAENYLQHAEHYSRLLGEAQRQAQEQRQVQDQQQQRDTSSSSSSRRDEPQQRRAQNQDSGEAQDSDDSALATIDPGDYDDASGPVETPESRFDRNGAVNRDQAAPAEAPAAAEAEQQPPVAEVSAPQQPDAEQASAPVASVPAATEGQPEGEAAPMQASGEEEPEAPRRRTRRKPRTTQPAEEVEQTTTAAAAD